MDMRAFIQWIEKEAGSWAGVVAVPHRFGGTEFRMGSAEIGHIHRDGTLDIPFPMSVRNQLLAEKLVRPHHYRPESGWITLYVHEDNVRQALELLRLSYLRRVLREAVKSGGWGSPAVASFLSELHSVDISSDLLHAVRESARAAQDHGTKQATEAKAEEAVAR